MYIIGVTNAEAGSHRSKSDPQQQNKITSSILIIFPYLPNPSLTEKPINLMFPCLSSLFNFVLAVDWGTGKRV
jgi:hypothetical protein